MASQALRQLYFEAREHSPWMIVGENAIRAMSTARILRKWEALEALSLVRLIDEPDEDYEWDGDGLDPSPDETAYGSVGQFRMPGGFGHVADQEWHNGDSVWGHVGYKDVLDWRENPYIVGIMAETMEAFKSAWKIRVNRRCPLCRQPLSVAS